MFLKRKEKYKYSISQYVTILCNKTLHPILAMRQTFDYVLKRWFIDKKIFSIFKWRNHIKPAPKNIILYYHGLQLKGFSIKLKFYKNLRYWNIKFWNFSSISFISVLIWQKNSKICRISFGFPAISPAVVNIDLVWK